LADFHDGFGPGALATEPFDTPAPLPIRPRKFHSRLWLHLALFGLTLASTTLIGADHYAAFAGEFGRRSIGAIDWPTYLAHGFFYSVTLLAILGAHEMGHYVFCRRYDVDATLPFFIPMPIVLTGTLGAVIRIREAFPTRRVLFDIGVAGPLAGFAVIVPALFIGLSLSTIVPEPTQGGLFYLGEPLLFKLATALVFGPIKDGLTINLHPIGFAAWFGLFATALNLLPFGQLDGGHITYSTLGRRSTPISIATVSGAVAMTFVSISWLVMTVIMVVMMFMFGPHHPRVIYEQEPIGRGRIAIAILALIVFIVSFTPVPIDVKDILRNP
jgi:membrane-associated protease RseP (regulator of RpoE activity)